MKPFFPFLFVLITLGSCERATEPISVPAEEVEGGNASAMASRSPASTGMEDIKEKAIALVQSRTKEMQVTSDALVKLESMAPELLNSGLLVGIVAAVPDVQLPMLDDYIFKALENVAPQAGKSFAADQYEEALHLATRTDPTRVAPLVFPHLPLAPAYEYPAFKLPKGWGDGDLSVHMFRGTQGKIATTVVEYGDEALMNRYREQLKSAAPQLQRVMAWALSRSPEVGDFNLLWELRQNTEDAKTADVIKRAMNVIPRTMKAFARDPNLRQVNRLSVPAEELKEMAQECRERLRNADLEVILDVWD